MSLLKKIMGMPGGVPFGRGRRVTSTQVSYTADGEITNIDPITVTYADGQFSVPSGVTEFTFQDDGTTVTASFDGATWTFVPLYEFAVTGTAHATPTNGTMVFSATEDLTVESTGEVTVSTVRADDDVYRSHTVTVSCPQNGAGTIVIAEKDKIVSLGNHRGALAPSVDFYAGTVASMPIMDWDFGNVPVSVEKIRQGTDLSTALPTTGSVAVLTNLTYVRVNTSNTLSGSVAALINLTRLEVYSSTTLSGSIAELTDLRHLEVYGSNTLSGSIATLTKLAFLDVRGSNTISYGAHTRAVNQIYFRTSPAAEHGWSVADLSQALQDNAATTWTSSKVHHTIGNHSSMADTNQGGLWGDYSGEAAPSATATALKTLVKTLSVTVSLNDVTQPGETGDGTGFPAGFGDWWRS